MSTNCPSCSGTGESGFYAVLDCREPGCTASFDRAEFNAYMAALGPMTQYDRDWAAYRYGRDHVKETKQWKS